MRKMKFLAGISWILLLCNELIAQPTFPENGVADPRHGHYAFTNATIVKDVNTTLTNATLVIKDGKIVSVGTNLSVPAGAVEVDCKGKYLYPSFIDIYTDYGTPQRQQTTTGGFNFFAQQQIESNIKGPYGWNQAIKSDVDVYKVFNVNETSAKPMREAGFGTVLTHVKDGVARGTGAVVTLANEKENLAIVKEKASAHYSFSKGTSTQSYPSSMMGYIALLRQTFLDAAWYKNKPDLEGFNLSLQAWNDNQNLPQIFEANDKWNDLRADRIGDEFGVQYIIKAGQNEYQRIKEMKTTNATFIVPLNYPQAQDVEDPNDARFVSLEDMKHWELAPTNPAAFEKAGISFCITASDLRTVSLFWSSLRKAMDYGLSETKALDALTKTPATTLGVYDKVGSLDAGKLANFLITNGPIFNEKTNILFNYVQGIKYTLKDDGNITGSYNLTVNTASGTEKYTLDVKSSSSLSMYGKDTLNTKFSFDGKQIKLSYAPMPKRQRPSFPVGDSSQRRGGFPGGFGAGQTPTLPASATRLSGVTNGTEWNGTGMDSVGNALTWTAIFVKAIEVKADTIKKKEPPVLGKVTYPFLAFGWDEANQPKQETIQIGRAHV